MQLVVVILNRIFYHIIIEMHNVTSVMMNLSCSNPPHPLLDLSLIHCLFHLFRFMPFFLISFSIWLWVKCVHFCCSLTPHRSESYNLESVVISENFPITAVSLFTAAGPHYTSALTQVISRANSVYSNFMKSEEGQGFSGQVGVICCFFSILT